MLRSALAAIVLLAVLILSGSPADAHSLARSPIPVPRHAAELVAAPFSQTHGGITEAQLPQWNAFADALQHETPDILMLSMESEMV